MPALAQWDHENGVQAVTRYGAAYDKAKITVKCSPGEYEKLVSAALLTHKVPDIFEYGNGPTLDMIKAPGCGSGAVRPVGAGRGSGVCSLDGGFDSRSSSSPSASVGGLFLCPEEDR